MLVQVVELHRRAQLVMRVTGYAGGGAHACAFQLSPSPSPPPSPPPLLHCLPGATQAAGARSKHPACSLTSWLTTPPAPRLPAAPQPTPDPSATSPARTALARRTQRAPQIRLKTLAAPLPTRPRGAASRSSSLHARDAWPLPSAASPCATEISFQ